MTRKEITKILALLKAAFPKFYEGADTNTTLSVWEMALDDYSYEEAAAAVKAVIKTCTFAPAPAEVINKIHSIRNINTLTESDAWEICRKASRNYYAARESFEAMPETLKRIVGSPETIRSWAQMDTDEFETVVASNFKRDYRAAIQRKDTLDKLPESVRVSALRTSNDCGTNKRLKGETYHE